MFVTLMPCLYVLLCGPKIRNKDSCILYLDNVTKEGNVLLFDLRKYKNKSKEII